MVSMTVVLHCQDGSTCCMCKYFSSPQNTMSTARSLWLFISHRIHVWYIYLYLVDIYVNIPYMDAMSMVIAVLTGRISRVVCFLRILQKCWVRNQLEESPTGSYIHLPRTPCGVHFRCKNMQNKVDGVQGLSKIKQTVPFYLVVLLLSSRICEKKDLEKNNSLIVTPHHYCFCSTLGQTLGCHSHDRKPQTLVPPQPERPRKPL